MGDLRREQIHEDLRRGVNTHKCICEYLRLAYDEVYQLPDNPQKTAIIERLIDCFLMGKKMQSRLIQYRRTYEPERRPGSGLEAFTYQEAAFPRGSRS